MPRDKSIQKAMVIGSGPIVIGQAAEFDYAGTQALRALKEEGIEILLVNSNPATIMTDKAMADKIYIEPLTLTTVRRILEKERPDSILSGLGGQTGLNLCMQLATPEADGTSFLDKLGIRLLGAGPETIDKAEDRLLFKEAMQAINQPVIPSAVVETVEDAVAFARTIGYPVIVRPAFTLGGSGGGIAEDEAQLRETAHGGILASPINQILVEKCISGWKEIEFEVMRDRAGNAITVCSMENFDPVGIHTGDSIVIAPAVTLSDKEYQMLRTAALEIICALGVEGGCNCQFALHPHSFEYAVIEVNPRVSRSSALASKATGYPIAKVATKIAVGYTLDEIPNQVTGETFAAFEPALDYVAVKFPKWPFDKFVYAKRELGTQMKATGEVMSIADSFEMALMKAIRGAEISLQTPTLPKLAAYTDAQLHALLAHATDERLFAVYECLRRGQSVDDIHQTTRIDKWFLYKLVNLLACETDLADQPLTVERYVRAKQLGFTDKTIRALSGQPLPCGLAPTYKMVDTCAGEFAATTPYFYATYNTAAAGGENEALPFIQASTRPRILVIGSGPIRIGQGIEFDYSSVHCVWTLKELGYEVVIVNNNPETVSTDFDTAHRLYFEPLTDEDVLHIIDLERPSGVIVAFGGQTAIRLTKCLSRNGIQIIGTSADGIDAAEDRERFDALLEKLQIKRPQGTTVMTLEQALAAAHSITYPVLVRPSYVLGGQNMNIAYGDDDMREYMQVILAQKPDSPVLIDKYLSGTEIEVDAICDGESILMPGIMEHIERTGVHSGDSIAVYPPISIDDNVIHKVKWATKMLCRGLKAIGLVNLQYIVKDGEIYVIEVNPRASRTVPYLSKVTGVPMCDLAVRVSLGEKLEDLGYGTGCYPNSPFTAVKVPVFSFEKLTDVDTQLGPEMKSTGEVLGIGRNLQEALYKGLVAAGYTMERQGGVLITVRDADKPEITAIAKRYKDLGFALYATDGTAKVLAAAGLPVTIADKIHVNPQCNTMTLLESDKISYIISTSAKGRDPARDSVKIRRKASALRIPCLTSLDTAGALADSLTSKYSEINTEPIDINRMRVKKRQLHFVKMQGCGNDYIYIDCLAGEMDWPESLSQLLSDRHFGIGGDGIVLICKSDVADVRMRMFNLDGSEASICGNALRCVAKYLYDNGLLRTTNLTIQTRSGIRAVNLITQGGQVWRARADMGKAELSAAQVPVELPVERVIDYPVRVADLPYNVTCLSMGNPHCVVFCSQDISDLPVEVLGPQFEHSPLFPQRVNTEFVQIAGDNILKMRVWERGNGETMACGSGACAAAVAAVLTGHCDKSRDIRVLLRGGELVVRYTDEAVYLTGDAKKVFEGVVEI